jgi:hypothetical protein
VARADGVDADPVLRQLKRKALRQANAGGFAGAVRTVAKATALAGNGIVLFGNK